MENIIFYKISCKDESISDVYIGSTNDFKKRINKHKYNCNNENSSNHNYKVYSYIRDNGGWSNWTVDEIERLMCDKNERYKREGYWIEYYDAKLNMSIPSRGDIGINEYMKLYREKHKDEIFEKKKIYREQHRDEIKEQKKLYYQKHKDELNKKIECECGATVSKQHLTHHRKSKKHIDRMNK